MQSFIPELLKEINDDISKLANYKDDAALKILFCAAFMPENKIILPDGVPPYKEDSAPLGMSPAILKQELRKLYVFCRKDLKPVKREDLFIQLLENIHPSEAKILIALKDQNLTTLYPKITHKVVFENGFIPNPPPEKVKKESKAKKSIGVVE